MDPEPPVAGGAASPTPEQQPANPKTTPHVPIQSAGPTSSTCTQPSSSSATAKGQSSDKNKGLATIGEEDGKGKQVAKQARKPPPPKSSKKAKTSASGSKQGKGKQSRKLDANKVAGLEKRKRSIAWDHFKMVPKEEVSDPTAECIHCGHRFLSGSKEHGTSNLLAHIKKCPKLHMTTDASQKLLDFEGTTSGKQLAGSVPQAFDMKECRKALSVFVICDEQPFKVVEGFGFKYLCKHLSSRF